MIGGYPDEVFLLPWRDGRECLAFRPWSGWARLLDAEAADELRSRCRPGPGEVPAWLRLRPFRPSCLTLLASRGICELACSYCYAASTKRCGPKRFDEPALRAAADVALEAAFRAGRSLVLGLHGGGEPLGDFPAVRDAVELVGERASARGMGVEIWATTSGVAGGEALAWAAENLTGVTLSWDGPAEVHDRQRPLRGGGGSHAAVMAALRLFQADLRRRIKVRATVTDFSLPELCRGVDELLEVVGDQRPTGSVTLQLEPVFEGAPNSGRPRGGPKPARFTEVFLELMDQVSGTPLRLELAGARILEPHGRHCPIWQSNLSLQPDGRAVACFLPRGFESTIIGRYDAELDRFRLHGAQLERLRRRTSVDDPDCADCFIRDHCSRHCPHLCPLVPEDEAHDDRPRSLCRLHRQIAFAQLVTRARGGRPLGGGDRSAIMETVGLGPDERLVPEGR